MPLPPPISPPASRQQLDLSGCEVASLPASFSQLSRLSFLDLAANLLHSLPPPLLLLPRLQLLDLSGNEGLVAGYPLLLLPTTAPLLHTLRLTKASALGGQGEGVTTLHHPLLFYNPPVPWCSLTLGTLNFPCCTLNCTPCCTRCCTS